MKISQYGIILNTQNYQRCVDFYRDILGLVVLFQKDTETETLTCFEMGGVYLMIEPGGQASEIPKPIAFCPTKLRLNTPDVENGVTHLRAAGVTVDLCHHSWGTTAEFADPDGNRCALRSDDGFG